MRCYRIVRPVYAATALSGEGARLYGGRWSPPGWRCVYTAGSRALAALEMLVHLNGKARLLPYRILEIEVEDRLIAPPRDLPLGWDSHPSGNASQNHGLDWLKSSPFAALKVPSVVIPEEINLLLNPLNPEFYSIRAIEETVFPLDQRLL